MVCSKTTEQFLKKLKSEKVGKVSGISELVIALAFEHKMSGEASKNFNLVSIWHFLNTL